MTPSEKHLNDVENNYIYINIQFALIPNHNESPNSQLDFIISKYSPRY